MLLILLQSRIKEARGIATEIISSEVLRLWSEVIDALGVAGKLIKRGLLRWISIVVRDLAVNATKDTLLMRRLCRCPRRGLTAL